VDPPKGVTIICPHWNFRIKTDGTRRAQQCCDGSKQAAPHLPRGTDTFASSLEHPMWRMFMGLCAAHCLLVYGSDAQDAHAHAHEPLKPTFVHWDDTKIEWWLVKTGQGVSNYKASEILHATQCHPEAGNAWECFITGVLHSLSFRGTTHEKNIHQMPQEKSIVLLARQVDDIALGYVGDETACGIMTLIDKCIQLPSETVIPITFQGLIRACPYCSLWVTKKRT
jgi:hypothetical protein